MSAVAGWYPDPNGTVGQLRWWDGARWTEHVTPAPDAAPQAAAAAQPPADDVPAAAEPEPAATEPEPAAMPGTPVAAGWGSGSATGATGAAPTQGTAPPPTTPAAPSWGSTGGGVAGAPVWQAPQRPSSNGVRIGLIVAAVVAVVLASLVGVAFIRLVGLGSSFSDFAVEVGSEEGFGDGFHWDGEVVTGEQVTLGGTADGSVPDGGIYEFELVVPSGGAVTIDVRADGFDAVAQITDATGTTIAENDDRDFSSGGDSFDPLIEVDLEPGTYRVQVRGFAGDFGDFEVRTS